MKVLGKKSIAIIISPLEGIQLGLVSQVVLDYMHCICLGVMKKLLLIWLGGPLKTRLPSYQNKTISSYLSTISKFLPKEFTRKSRSLKDIKRYKATEFRQFLLYTGPVVLRGILPNELYSHFLLLSSATYVLLSKNSCLKYWNDMAKRWMEKFVQQMSEFYGKTSVIYNVHALLHISDDAIKFGSLDNVSAFPFENHLQFLKSTIRGKSLFIEQVVKRVQEQENCKFIKERSTPKLGPVGIKSRFIRRYFLEKFSVSSKLGDNCFVAVGGDISLVQQIKFGDKNEVLVEVIKVEVIKVENRSLISKFPKLRSCLGLYKIKLTESSISTIPLYN